MPKVGIRAKGERVCRAVGSFGMSGWEHGDTLMKRPALLAIGALLILVGIIWTLQGLGYLPGSVMSGVTMWAVIGPVVALVGILLVVRGSRSSGGPGSRRRGGGPEDTERR